MADVKISALPLATTPLAGTEVLPIVQSATTDQVSVANLTAGRAVSAASLTLTTTPLAVGSGGTGLTSLTAGYIPFGGSTTYGSDSNLFWDNTNKRLGIGTASPSSALHVVGGEFRLDSASGAVGRWYYNGTNVGTIYVTSDTMLMGAEGSRSFVINTNGSEKLRLTADGNLLVGTTSVVSSGKVVSKVSGANPFVAWNPDTSGDNGLISFGTEGTYTERGYIYYDRAAGQVKLSPTSDYRAKDIGNITVGSLEKVNAMKIRDAKLKWAEGAAYPMFIAHEIQEVAPWAVSGEKDAVYADGKPKYQLVDPASLVPTLAAAIQELAAKVQALEAKVA